MCVDYERTSSDAVTACTRIYVTNITSTITITNYFPIAITIITKISTTALWWWCFQ